MQITRRFSYVQNVTKIAGGKENELEGRGKAKQMKSERKARELRFIVVEIFRGSSPRLLGKYWHSDIARFARSCVQRAGGVFQVRSSERHLFHICTHTTVSHTRKHPYTSDDSAVSAVNNGIKKMYFRILEFLYSETEIVRRKLHRKFA